MMKVRRFLPLLLLLTVSLLAACGAQSGGGEPENAAETAPPITEAETQAETTRAPLDLPEKDYEGYGFHFLHKPDARAYVINDLMIEDKFNGEPINDAMYRRNMTVEEAFNIFIGVVSSTDTAADTRKLVMAGDAACDVVMPLIDRAFRLAEEELLCDLNTVDHIDLTKEWWDQVLREELTIYGRLYVSTGDISIMDEQTGMCLLYNYTLAGQSHLPDVYALIREGKWTLDECLAMARTVTRDLNGDGQLNADDVFGLGTSAGMADTFYGCANGKIAEWDGDTIRLVADSERNTKILDKCIELLNASDAVIFADKIPESWTGMTNMFIANRLLFRQGNLYNLKALRDMTDNFGILPFPKYDENDDYANRLEADECWGYAIPVSASDTERSAIVLEALAYNSAEIIEAYYDLTLKTKTARDEASKDMLDIIISSKTYDLGDVYGWGSVNAVMRTAAQNNGGFASEYAKVAEKAAAEMQATLAFFRQ